MASKVAITCTTPRCDEIVIRLQSLNINAIAMPALIVNKTQNPCPQGDFNAMLITSSHAITDDLPDLPVIAIGQATANIIKKKGLTVIQVGTRNIQDLDFSNHTSILYPCATEPTEIPYQASAWPVYETTINPNYKIRSDIDAIAVFSIKAARAINTNLKLLHPKHPISASPLENNYTKYICFSQAIADVFTHVPADRLAVCPQPDYDEMEQLIIKVLNTCQK